ncbi:MAG: flavodoxin domain-containing protein [Oscillospiraceae bacterium]|jgi:menaquinone-dependent protoporphyrinogen oxidase
MKTLIVFVTKNGTTEECAQILREKLGHDSTDLVNLRVQKLPDFDAYDCIVLGSYIHYGRIGKRLKHFAALHKDTLLQKKLGIYLCKGFPIDKLDPFEENFKPKLLKHAVVCDCFGGVLDTKRLKGNEKYLADMVLQASEDQKLERPRIDKERIERFVEALLQE